LDAGAEPQPAAAEVLGAVAGLQPAEALAAGAEPQQAAVAGVELGAAARQLAAGEVPAVSPRAAVRPSAAPWVFRRGRVLLWLGRRRAARSAHAMRMSQAASRSELSWPAARGEGLS
jgi:hypothetical protein